MKKKMIFILFFLFFVALLTSSSGAEIKTLSLSSEVQVDFVEVPLWGPIQVVKLPNNTLLTNYISQNTNWRSLDPYYQVYGEHLEIIDRDGHSVWSKSFRVMDEATLDSANYLNQFRIGVDKIFIELYFDPEMNNYGWYLTNMDGTPIEKSTKRVKLTDDDICYTVNLFPYLIEEYRQMDEFGNPRCTITHVPSNQIGTGVASNVKAVCDGKLLMAHVLLGNGQYALNIYNENCELDQQILLPFAEYGQHNLPLRTLCNMTANTEKITFIACTHENPFDYEIYVYDRKENTFSNASIVKTENQYMLPLCVNKDHFIFATQAQPPAYSFYAGSKTAPVNTTHLYSVNPDGEITALAQIEQDILWCDYSDQESRITLFVRNPAENTYHFLTYEIIQE